MTSYWKIFWIVAFGTLMLTACSNELTSVDRAENQNSTAHEDAEDEDDDRGVISLSDLAAEAAGIRVEIAQTGRVGDRLNLPAEVRFDADRVAQISPQIGGIVRKLYATEGDDVTRGQRLALIASRELADLKSDLISARAATDLAQTTLKREERLWTDKITSEADLLAARAGVSAANANLQAIKGKLQTLGLSPAQISSDNSGANFVVTSPLAGTIVQRSVSLGAAVNTDDTSAEPLFTIVDDGVVWVDIAVFKQDLSRLDEGTKVNLITDDDETIAQSEIAFISPIVDQSSRTATARVIVDNANGRLRPGSFIRAKIELGEGETLVRVPINAVQTVNATPSIFVPTEDGFAPKPVVTGQEQDGYISILRGLENGESYVAEGAFTLKSQLEKDSFGADDD